MSEDKNKSPEELIKVILEGDVVPFPSSKPKPPGLVVNVYPKTTRTKIESGDTSTTTEVPKAGAKNTVENIKPPVGKKIRSGIAKIPGKGPIGIGAAIGAIAGGAQEGPVGAAKGAVSGAAALPWSITGIISNTGEGIKKTFRSAIEDIPDNERETTIASEFSKHVTKKAKELGGQHAADIAASGIYDPSDDIKISPSDPAAAGMKPDPKTGKLNKLEYAGNKFVDTFKQAHKDEKDVPIPLRGPLRAAGILGGGLMGAWGGLEGAATQLGKTGIDLSGIRTGDWSKTWKNLKDIGLSLIHI